LLLLGAESFVFQFANQKLKIKVYRMIILPVVLYGYGNLSLTLREERRLRVYILFTHQQMHFLLNLEKFKFT